MQEKQPAWAESARKRGLGEGDIRRLAEQKVLVTNEAFQQVFTPYIKRVAPLFITSDSILNAFHVLFEESVFRLESVNAGRLPGILETVWTGLDRTDDWLEGRPELVREARRRARILLGTALALLDAMPAGGDEDLRRTIAGEAARVVDARAVLKPAWLGPVDPGFVALDYSRYRPRGFYTRTPELERYFRAVSWLQSVPHRVAIDEELLAAAMLGAAIAPGRSDAADAERLEPAWAFLRQFRAMVGAGDDWDVLAACEAAAAVRPPLDLDEPAALRGLRDAASRLVAKYGLPEVNDTIRLPPGGPAAAEPNFRVLSAARIPESVVFTRTTNPMTRGFPDGLEVCVALGSDFARSTLLARSDIPPSVLESIDRARGLFDGTSLYQEYLRCVAALLDEPERGVPAFMASRAWQAKSCQTALGGWAQLRHTWMLQAKQSVTFLGMYVADPEPDVVEPDPEFFARLSRLAARTREILREAGALRIDEREIALDLSRLADWLEETGAATPGSEGLFSRAVLESDPAGARYWLHPLVRALGIEGFDAGAARKAIEALRRLAGEVREGKMPSDPKLAAALRMGVFEIEPRWTKLIETSSRLEALARKQLRGKPFDGADRSFIEAYGATIAHIMLYGGNSYLRPRDDAPRVADVHCNPNDRERPYLHAGIARPRALWVLYPGRRGDYLCRGAVLPYYEFLSRERLTDSEWKALLDDDGRPSPPEWMEPIICEGGLRKPKLPRD